MCGIGAQHATPCSMSLSVNDVGETATLPISLSSNRKWLHFHFVRFHIVRFHFVQRACHYRIRQKFRNAG